MNHPPLECTGVHKRHGTQPVLRGVDFRLPEGAVVGLVGRNGAGKSTLIRILLGLDAPDAGEARVFGRPAEAMDDDARRRLGYVPQEASAFAWMRVGDMLALVGRSYPSWDAAFVDAQLDRWRLDRAQLLARLSPGERQRVAIIRALAPDPSLLVLDEPAAALDPVARRDLLREIAGRAADSGTTVLFSTHIVSDLERVASHVAFLHDGRIALTAALDDLKERHARLLVPAALAGAAAAPLAGELRRRGRPGGGLAITLVRDAGAPWPALAEAAGVQRDTLALEDLFIEVSE
jgi:ABC-2 type transport system ATP-binding protein